MLQIIQPVSTQILYQTTSTLTASQRTSPNPTAPLPTDRASSGRFHLYNPAPIMSSPQYQQSQQSPNFLTLLPSNHATFSASTVAPDTIAENSSVLSNADLLVSPIELEHKTRRSSSTTTSSSVGNSNRADVPEVTAAPGTEQPIRKSSTFLRNH